MKSMLPSREKVFKFGFTGTSEEVKEEQLITLEKVIKKIARKKNVEHHNGGCINADKACYDIVRALIPSATIIMHPPKNTSKMFPYFDSEAYKGQGAVISRPPLDYLKRNMQIVAESDFLVATPKSVAEELRSGTWATIRYARIARIPILIVWPNGSIRQEKPEAL